MAEPTATDVHVASVMGSGPDHPDTPEHVRNCKVCQAARSALVSKSTPGRRRALLALASARRRNLRRIANGQRPLRNGKEVDVSSLGPDAPSSPAEARDRLRKELGPQTCLACHTSYSGATFVTCPAVTDVDNDPHHLYARIAGGVDTADITSVAKALGSFGRFLPDRPSTPTTWQRPDPRVHSHPFDPDPERPSRCLECGMGTGVHSRMVPGDQVVLGPRRDARDQARESGRRRRFRKFVADTARALCMSPAEVEATFPAPTIDLTDDLAYTVTKSDDAKRFTLGPVYMPDTYDAHGEWADASTLQSAAWDFVRTQPRTIYLQHSPKPAGEWVEIMSWPYEVEATLTVPGAVAKSTRTVTFPADTVYMGVIWEPWAYDEIRKGTLTGFSMGGVARRVEAIVQKDVQKDVEGKESGPFPDPDPDPFGGARGIGEYVDRASFDWVEKFDPNQPRDDHGRWTDAGGAGGGAPSIPPGASLSSAPATHNTIPGFGDIGGSTKGTGGSLTELQYANRRAYIDTIMSPGHEWASGGPHDSAVLHTDGKGNYLPERQLLHDQIIDATIASAEVRGVPSQHRAVLMGGLSGAGKSTALRTGAAEALGVELSSSGAPSNFLVVNPDDFKEVLVRRNLIETVPGLTPMESAHLAHEESSHIAARVARAAEARGLNVIWDFTLGSSGSGSSKLRDLTMHGYTDIRGLFVDVSVDTSVASARSRHRRGVDRYLAGQGMGGRAIPESYIRAASHTNGARVPSRDGTLTEARSKNRVAFHELVNSGYFTRAQVIDNEADFAGELVFDWTAS